MVKQNIDERRRWVRAKRVLSIQYRLTKSKSKKFDTKWDLSMTEDMGLGGLAFHAHQEYHVGDILEMKVVMSGVLDLFSGYAEVVRIQKNKNTSFSKLGVKYMEKTKKKERKVSKKRSASRI